MDPSAFDTLARSFATSGTRLRLLTLLVALPLGGALTTSSGDEAAAQHPIDRLQQRTPQRNRKQRNNLNTKNTKNTSKNGGGGGNDVGPGQDCGGCPQGHVCCGNGQCCPTDRPVCCGTGSTARCCPGGVCCSDLQGVTCC